MKHLLAASLALLGSVAAACYQDDTLHPAAISPTRVLITDDPFPFDTVGSVNLYVSRIEASPSLDTSTGVNWVTIAEPNKLFDLLTLQQGATAFLGEGTIDAGKYAAIRMTIDVDRSSIKYKSGADAVVHWPYPGHGQILLYALVEKPVAVSAAGAVIVLIVDVGRSFLYNLTDNQDFVMNPVLRAVSSAATGTIAGQVTGPDFEGNHTPIQNANVMVFGGDPSRAESTWYVAATGRTGAQGDYTIAFLSAGSWIVRVEQPDLPGLDPVLTGNVVVTAGTTTPLSVFLPRAGAGGSFLRIAGPDAVGVGGTIGLAAAVGDSVGIPVSNPVVTWSSRDTTIALVLQDSASAGDSLAFVQVLGRAPGKAWIVATSGALRDSVPIAVVQVAPVNPVASVTLTPSSLTIALGDSAPITAELRDSAGNVLTSRQISWFLTDSSGVAGILWASGATAWIRANTHGTTHLRAASESKFKDATITVP
jgi:hypothetical protein